MGESTHRDSLSLFPHPLTAIEPRAAGQAAAGDAPPLPCSSARREEEDRALLPITPSPIFYFIKNPSTLWLLCKNIPALYDIHKQTLPLCNVSINKPLTFF